MYPSTPCSRGLRRSVVPPVAACPVQGAAPAHDAKSPPVVQGAPAAGNPGLRSSPTQQPRDAGAALATLTSPMMSNAGIGTFVSPGLFRANRAPVC